MAIPAFYLREDEVGPYRRLDRVNLAFRVLFLRGRIIWPYRSEAVHQQTVPPRQESPAAVDKNAVFGERSPAIGSLFHCPAGHPHNRSVELLTAEREVAAFRATRNRHPVPSPSGEAPRKRWNGLDGQGATALLLSRRMAQAQPGTAGSLLRGRGGGGERRWEEEREALRSGVGGGGAASVGAAARLNATSTVRGMNPAQAVRGTTGNGVNAAGATSASRRRARRPPRRDRRAMRGPDSSRRERRERPGRMPRQGQEAEVNLANASRGNVMFTGRERTLASGRAELEPSPGPD